MAHMQVGAGGGSGYSTTPAPTVNFAGGNPSTIATAEAIVDATYQTIVAIRVIDGGSGYSSIPQVYISSPASGKTASAMAIMGGTINNMFVKQIILTGGDNPGGYGYTSATVTITGTGSNAQATAIIDSTYKRLVRINVDIQGTGYSSEKTVVSISAPNDPNTPQEDKKLATAYAVISSEGQVTNIFLNGELPKGTSIEQFKDDATILHSDWSLINNYDEGTALVGTNESFLVEKDFQAGGMISSQQGALALNYGFRGKPWLSSPPSIYLNSSQVSYPSGDTLPTNPQVSQLFTLTSTYGSYPAGQYMWNGGYWGKVDFSGKYDTLFLFKVDEITPANMVLGDLTVHGKLDMIDQDSPLNAYRLMLKRMGTSGSSSLMRAAGVSEAAEDPHLVIESDNATILFSNDCNLYRTTKTMNEQTYTVLETDNYFVAPAIDINQLVVNQDSHFVGTLELVSSLKTRDSEGTSGQVLMSQGPGVAPLWSSSSWNGGTVTTPISIKPSSEQILKLGYDNTAYYAITFYNNALTTAYAAIGYRTSEKALLLNYGSDLGGAFGPVIVGNNLTVQGNLTMTGGGQTGTQSIAGIYANPNADKVQISLETNGGIEGGMFGHSNGNFYIGSWSYNPLKFRTNNTDYMTLDTAGNLTVTGWTILAGGDVPQDIPKGITWYSPTPENYGIYRTPGAWSSPNYQQLKIAWATGICITDKGLGYPFGVQIQPEGGVTSIGGPLQLGDSVTRLYRSSAGVVQVQNYTGGSWQLGTLDASNVFADHINSASGAGISYLDYVRGGLSISSPTAADVQTFHIHANNGSVDDRVTFYMNHNANWVQQRALSLWYYPGDSLGGCCHDMQNWGIDASGNNIITMYGNTTINGTLNCGSISCSGAITLGASNYIYFGGADTYLQRQSAGVIGVMNNGGLGTLNVSNLFADHINSASGSGIYVMAKLKAYSSSGALIQSYQASASNGGIAIENNYGNMYFIGGGTGNHWNVMRSSSGTDLLEVWYSGYVAVPQTLSASNVPVYSNSSGVLYNQSSALKYKEHVTEIKECSWVYDLSPVTFYWKQEEQALRGDQQEIGLIADDVEQINPILTYSNAKGEVEGVRYEKLAVPMLVEMKKLRDRITALEAQLKKQQAAA